MLAALLWWGGAEAQDVILLRNADEVKAEVREITDSHILYTLWGGSDKVLSLPRAEVFSVTYQNGEKELFVGDDSGATGPVTAADYPICSTRTAYGESLSPRPTTAATG